jgi:hypothetical protein
VWPKSGGSANRPGFPLNLTKLLRRRHNRCLKATMRRACGRSEACGSNLAARHAGVASGIFGPSEREGAGKAGCRLHPRSRVQKCALWTHTSIQVQPKQPGFPRAMVLRRTSCSPRRANSSCHRRLRKLTAGLAPATGVRTTRLGRTPRRFVRRFNTTLSEMMLPRLTPKRPSHPQPYAS